ncbi:A24 family peptidase [Actinocorallia longicatena]|uniref:Prepilin type IV endopeptidase peptidase domain-containing protein n=1 Tax=Actinocorallia longicatena TaxID=111803 RepID=A0ABP6QC66_9ACTN
MEEIAPRDPWFDPVRERPWAVTGVAVAVCALITWRLGWRSDLPAFLVLGVGGTLLAVIDVALKRLPDPLTLPGAAMILALLALSGEGSPAGAVYGALGLFAFYGIQWFALPGHIGLGDVKLALSLGALLGWLGLGAVIGGVVAIHLLGGLWAAGVIVSRRGGLGAGIPFGPFMVGGTLAAVLIYA